MFSTECSPPSLQTYLVFHPSDSAQLASNSEDQVVFYLQVHTHETCAQSRSQILFPRYL